MNKPDKNTGRKVDFNNLPPGWKRWRGGSCPLKPGTKFRCVLRNQATFDELVHENPENWVWQDRDSHRDIVAYKEEQMIDMKTVAAGDTLVLSTGDEVLVDGVERPEDVVILAEKGHESLLFSADGRHKLSGDRVVEIRKPEPKSQAVDAKSIVRGDTIHFRDGLRKPRKIVAASFVPEDKPDSRVHLSFVNDPPELVYQHYCSEDGTSAAGEPSWDIVRIERGAGAPAETPAKRPGVDLSTAEPGDTLVLADGDRVVFTKLIDIPHMGNDVAQVHHTKGIVGTRYKSTGRYIGENRRLDVVEVIKAAKPKPVDLTVLRRGDMVVLRDTSEHKVTGVSRDLEKWPNDYDTLVALPGGRVWSYRADGSYAMLMHDFDIVEIRRPEPKFLMDDLRKGDRIFTRGKGEFTVVDSVQGEQDGKAFGVAVSFRRERDGEVYLKHYYPNGLIETGKRDPYDIMRVERR